MEKKSSIIAIGLTVHNAPVELREKLAVPEAEWQRAIEELCAYPHIEEAAVLSTCNRMEIYVVALSFHRGARAGAAAAAARSRPGRSGPLAAALPAQLLPGCWRRCRAVRPPRRPPAPRRSVCRCARGGGVDEPRERRGARRAAPAPLPAARPRRDRAPAARGGRPRLAGHGRGPDPGPGQAGAPVAGRWQCRGLAALGRCLAGGGGAAAPCLQGWCGGLGPKLCAPQLAWLPACRCCCPPARRTPSPPPHRLDLPPSSPRRRCTRWARTRPALAATSTACSSRR